MADMMSIPESLEEFMEQYKIVDTEQIYTNGTEMVPIFRVKQWLDRYKKPEERPYTRLYTDRVDNDFYKATYILDMFTKSFCIDVEKSNEEKDLVFMCDKCPFKMDDDMCLVKKFRKDFAPEFKDFGCMGEL